MELVKSIPVFSEGNASKPTVFLEKSASTCGRWIPEVEWEYREVAREREVYKHFNMIKDE